MKKIKQPSKKQKRDRTSITLTKGNEGAALFFMIILRVHSERSLIYHP